MKTLIPYLKGNRGTENAVAKLAPAERSLLSTALHDGLIPFPHGCADTVERKIKTLLSLVERGYLCKKRRARIRGFYLTDSGRELAVADSPQPATPAWHNGDTVSPLAVEQ